MIVKCLRGKRLKHFGRLNAKPHKTMDIPKIASLSEAEGGMNNDGGNGGTSRYSWYIASRIVTRESIRFSLSSFDNFKFPGPDGIYPAMLKKGGDRLIER